jgi:uncharacterized protein (TIGR00369 family)
MSNGGVLQARNPNFDEVVRSALLSMPFARLLGLTVSHLAPGRAEVAVPNRTDLQQGTGVFQAAVIGAVADFAGGAAAGTLLQPEWALATTDFTVKIVAPGMGKFLVGRGEVVRPGGVSVVSRVEVFSSSDSRERLCAVAFVTTMAFEIAKRAAKKNPTETPACPVSPGMG